MKIQQVLRPAENNLSNLNSELIPLNVEVSLEKAFGSEVHLHMIAFPAFPTASVNTFSLFFNFDFIF